MLAAAEVFLLARDGNGPYCAKLHHHKETLHLSPLGIRRDESRRMTGSLLVQ
jgi:hypothetical protein